MAMLPQDDKQDPNAQSQPQGQQQPGAQGAGTPATGNSQSPVAGGGVGSSLPSAGSGGTQGWTNIQSYLNANQGSQGEANLLNQNAQDTANKEQSNYNTQAGQAQGQAQSQIDNNNISQDKASQLITQATQAGSAAPQYSTDVQQLQKGINGTYNPGSFSYGQTGQFQNALGAMGGNPDQFNSYMSGIYQKAAGPMSSGAQALQSQLDAGNGNIQSARQNALMSLSGLGTNLGTQAQQLNTDMGSGGKYAQQFQGNEDALKNYVQGQGDQNKGAIDQRVSDANAYLNTLAQQVNQGWINRNTGGTSIWRAPASFSPMSQPASEANVSGVDTQRNTYNTIQSILNGQPIVAQTFDPNQVQFKDANGPDTGTYNTVQDLLNMGVISQPSVNQLDSYFAPTASAKPIQR